MVMVTNNTSGLGPKLNKQFLCKYFLCKVIAASKEACGSGKAIYIVTIRQFLLAELFLDDSILVLATFISFPVEKDSDGIYVQRLNKVG